MTTTYTVRPFDGKGRFDFTTRAMAVAYFEVLEGQGRKAMLIRNIL